MCVTDTVEREALVKRKYGTAQWSSYPAHHSEARIVLTDVHATSAMSLELPSMGCRVIWNHKLQKG